MRKFLILILLSLFLVLSGCCYHYEAAARRVTLNGNEIKFKSAEEIDWVYIDLDQFLEAVGADVEIYIPDVIESEKEYLGPLAGTMVEIMKVSADGPDWSFRVKCTERLTIMGPIKESEVEVRYSDTDEWEPLRVGIEFDRDDGVYIRMADIKKLGYKPSVDINKDVEIIKTE